MTEQTLGAPLARLGVDTGGTFTDFVLWRDGRVQIHKQLSTPEAPERAILEGIAALGLQPGEYQLIHGSTVATNAALEGKGVRTAYVGNQGFEDLLTLGRQARRELYNLQAPVERPPVPEALCFGVNCRVDAHGQVITPLSSDAIDALVTEVAAQKPEAVAINLLFSFLYPQHELILAAALREALPGVFVCCSSQVLPEYREYERGMATWLNAWLGPLMQGYLQRLQNAVAPSPVSVMQSSGGTLAAKQASRRAVNLLLSGPAGGLMAAQYVAECCGESQVLTFDMGGTSTDVARVSGLPSLTVEGHIGPFPVAVPMVDMHTIGAGGGSLAWIDDGGLLQVGPQSAGAYPGPACYGQGGRQATVTDANLLLGRLRVDAFLGGGMRLDLAAARQSIEAIAEPLGLSAEATAEGILQVANEHMAQALRVISVQQGQDPRDDALMAFGGAAGLQLCALAESLGMSRAIAPVHGGVLSALGMLVAPTTREVSRSLRLPLSDVSGCSLLDWVDEMSIQPIKELAAEGLTLADIERVVSLDLRYLGQSHSLNVTVNAGMPAGASLEDAERQFHSLHQQRYGHALEQVVELVNIRLSCRAVSAAPNNVLARWPVTAHAESVAHDVLYGYSAPVPIFERSSLALGQCIDGPALLTEAVSTVLVEPHWRALVDELGNLILTRVVA